jgi:hypothetical protein
MLPARDFDLTGQLAMFAVLGCVIVVVIIAVGALVLFVRYLCRAGRHRWLNNYEH